MEIKRLSIGVLALTITAFAASKSIAAIAVNGDMSDWGITVSGSDPNKLNFGLGITNSSGFLSDPNNGQPTIINDFLEPGIKLFYQAEDIVVGGRVGPLYGGQDYDVEFLGAFIKGSSLYIGIVSGQRPDNGRANYSPGDIRLAINGKLFGIEVGGGEGHGNMSPDLGAISYGADGSTYDLATSGHTNSVSTPPGTMAHAQVAGSVWEPQDWLTDIDFPNGNGSQFQITTGDYVGTSEYIFTRDSLSDEHSFIEVRVDLHQFMPFVNASVVDEIDVESIAWSPSCRNDILYIKIDDENSPHDVVPEPASLLVWSFVAAAVFGYRRRVQL